MQMTGRIAIAGASTVLAAGTMGIGSGPATATTSQAPAHHAAAAPAGTEQTTDRHPAARQPTDPWIEDQLAAFYPSSTKRLAVFDPWVKDQLALFGNGSR
ncbi:hypothetical protein [Streptomyces sp. NPDC014006]|uniref:hypothetical protein n=1 Tax=Streptomyces sp. NPDC014006 TaxID=3364870 RepID=UPI003702A40F